MSQKRLDLKTDFLFISHIFGAKIQKLLNIWRILCNFNIEKTKSLLLYVPLKAQKSRKNDYLPCLTLHLR